MHVETVHLNSSSTVLVLETLMRTCSKLPQISELPEFKVLKVSGRSIMEGISDLYKRRSSSHFPPSHLFILQLSAPARFNHSKSNLKLSSAHTCKSSIKQHQTNNQTPHSSSHLRLPSQDVFSNTLRTPQPRLISN